MCFKSSFNWFPANHTNGSHTVMGNPWINFDLENVTERVASA